MSRPPLGRSIPLPMSLGYVDRERFDAVFESIPTPALMTEPAGAYQDVGQIHNAAVIEARDIILGLFTGTRLTSSQVGMHLSKEVALPSEPARGVSSNWHSDCQGPSQVTVLISNALSTEFLFGQIPRRMRRAFMRYELSGHGDVKDYFAKVQEVLIAHTDQELEQAGFGIVSASPYQAFAFVEKNIHRSPLNKTANPITRSMVKATITCG